SYMLSGCSVKTRGLCSLVPVAASAALYLGLLPRRHEPTATISGKSPFDRTGTSTALLSLSEHGPGHSFCPTREAETIFAKKTQATGRSGDRRDTRREQFVKEVRQPARRERAPGAACQPGRRGRNEKPRRKAGAVNISAANMR